MGLGVPTGYALPLSSTYALHNDAIVYNTLYTLISRCRRTLLSRRVTKAKFGSGPCACRLCNRGRWTSESNRTDRMFVQENRIFVTLKVQIMVLQSIKLNNSTTFRVQNMNKNVSNIYVYGS